MERIVSYTVKNDGYRQNGALKPQGVMVHSTASPGIMAKAFRDRFNKAGLGKSVHGFVDDKVYVQCLPYTQKAGHCRYSGNDTHIGIEMCEPKAWETDSAYFAAVYANTVELTADLCKEFGIPVTPQTVLSHAEGYQLGIASNHSDVGHWWTYFGKTMDDFRAAVTAKMAAPKIDQEPTKKALQEALNASYKCGLAVDAIPGPKTQAAIKAHPLRYTKGKKLTSNSYVKWVQERLNALGYDLGTSGADGKYGAKTAAAVKVFQQASGLVVDGIVGIQTVLALLK